MMDRRHRQRATLIGVVFIVAVIFWKSLGSRDTYLPSRGGATQQQQPGGGGAAGSGNGITNTGEEVDLTGLRPANSTLGFGAIIAVSREGSPRREGLLLASNITEIDITIPPQPVWTDEDIKSVRAEHDSRINQGSVLAWLGHLNALRWFLSSNLETVMILEDDVDWDIHLRTIQVPQAAAAIRKLVREQTEPPGELEYKEDWNNYWGNSSTWDIMYLGHCGDIFWPKSWSNSIPRIMYPDPTLPPRRELHPYSAKFLESISIPEDTRVIHQSIFPLCTFGFALTRNAAYRLLTEIASREADGGTMAYDVRVLEGCRDMGLKCWSANPELFHHMDAQSEIANINYGVDTKAGADEEGRLKPLRAGKAPNIACGARSRNFFTRDEKTLEYLREVVGRQGRCLRDEMAEDSGRGVMPEKYEGPGDPRLYN